MNDSAKQFFKDYFSFGNLNTTHVGEISLISLLSFVLLIYK